MKILSKKYNFIKVTWPLAAIVALVLFFSGTSLAYSGYFLEKETLLLNNGKLTNQTTFELNPGDEVVVRLHLDPNTNTTTQYSAEDYRPKGSLPSLEPISTPGKCGLADDQKMLASTYNSNQDEVFSSFTNIEQGASGYLCYSYKLIYDPLPTKNILENITAYVFDPLNGNQRVANSNNYLLVKGSSSGPFVQNNDQLFSSFQSLFQNGTSGPENLAFSPSYLFSRGQGPNSRGGLLYGLPVQMTDSSGSRIFDQDSFYLLYNPLYSVLGNVFSAGKTIGGAVDLGSRSNAISNQPGPENAFISKLNSEAALYGYDFDKNSALYWDINNPQKNSQMNESIKKLITVPPPDIVCPLPNVGALSSSVFYLNNPNCSPTQGSFNNTWPNGRVWYFKTSGTVNIAATFHGRGTVIIDGDTTVNISTTASSFFDDNTFLGLIVINGGKVVFTKAATTFNGIVFAPGS